MKERLTIPLVMMSLLLTVPMAAQSTKVYKMQGDSLIVEAPRERPIPQFSTVATRLDMPLQQIPLSVGVINKSLIENQNHLNLGDALKNLSGVNAQTGFGVHDYFIIRGLNSLENSLILTDGTPEPEVTYYTLYNVEQVELLKGPGAFLYGSNPLSGTVNIVRKQPVFDRFLNIRSTAGQFSSLRSSIDAGVGNLKAGLAGRINVLYENADNYRDSKGNKVLAINPALTWNVNKRTALNLNFEYINSRYAPDSGLPLVYDFMTRQLDKMPDIPLTRSFQTPLDNSDQKIVRVKLNIDHKITSAITFQSRFYHTRLDWQSTGTLVNGAFPGMTGGYSVSRSLSDLDDDRSFSGNQSELIINFNTSKIRHQVLAGFEYTLLKEDYIYDIAPVIPSVDLFNPVETLSDIHQIVLYPYLRGDVSNRVFAPYLMDRISFSDRLQVIAGLRYDRIHFENKAQGYPADRSYNNPAPVLGVHFALIPEVIVYANTSRAFAPPSSQVVGEQDAERSRQVEFGVKQRYFGGRLNIDAAYYDLNKNNIAIPAMDGISRQLGDQRSRGFEADLSAELPDNWFTFLSWTYSDVELTRFYETVTIGTDEQGRPVSMVIDRSGNVPAFVPRQMLNLWTTKEFANGLGAGLGWRYTGPQFIDEDNVFEIDAAVLINLKIYYRRAHWMAGVTVRNITDKKTFYRGFGASSVIPADSRAVSGVVEVRL